MNITPAQIDYVLSQTKISDVIGQFVSWNKKKSNFPKGDFWACCPFHAEKSPSFHCEDHKGRYHCFGCNSSGNAINFLREIQGLTFMQAYKHLGGETRELTPAEKQEWTAKQRELEAQRVQKELDVKEAENTRINDVRSLWRTCVPYERTLSNQYLVNRGYDDLGPMPSIRFHNELYCELDKKRHPCMVAAVQNVDRDLVAVWRIFLDRNGNNLVIDGQKIKRGLGPASGGVVRLTPVEEEWNIGEGFESTLGAYYLSGRKGSFAASLSTSGMRGVVVPDNVKRIVAWADGDKSKFHPHTGEINTPPGQAAAQALVERGPNEGWTGRCMVPPTGSDWSDVWGTVRGDRDAKRDIQYID